MKTTYAVKWREPDERIYLGRLEFDRDALLLVGLHDGGPPVRRSVGYGEMTGFRVGQGGGDRLDGRPTLIVERPSGDIAVTSSVMHAGVLSELADRLAALRLGTPRRATVVVPLREGGVERARELAASGPPFDPEDTFLTRHQLLLTPFEAIFVFEADTDAALEDLLARLDIWAAAIAWQDVVAGTPRLAEVAYAWERPARLASVGLGL